MRSALKIIQNRARLCFMLGAAGCLYLSSFILPHTAIYQGDSSPIFLTQAERMLAGQMIYRDFFEFTLPGTQLVYLALFRVFGVRAWLPNAVFISLGLGLAWVGITISKRVLSGKSIYLPSLLFLAFAFNTEPDPTHHWFSTLAVMSAIAILMVQRSPGRIAGAGALCGLATLFTQSRGSAAVVGFAVFLLWEWRDKNLGGRALSKNVVCLFGMFLAVVLPSITILAWKVGLGRFVYCTIIFPLKYFPLWYWNTPAAYLSEVPVLPWPLELPALGVWLFMPVLIPLIYLLFLVRWQRLAATAPEEPWDGLMLVAVVGLFLFLSVASSPGWLRLCSGSLPALILLVWFVQARGRIPPFMMNFFWVLGLLVLSGQVLIAQTSTRHYLDSRIGRLAFFEPERYEKFHWVQDHTRPYDAFFQARDSDLYYPLLLRNPASVQFLTASGYTRPEQVQEVVESLEKRRVRFVLWSVWLDIPLHPDVDDAQLSPVRTYLKSHYHLVRNFGDPDYEQVWERNPE